MRRRSGNVAWGWWAVSCAVIAGLNSHRAHAEEPETLREALTGGEAQIYLYYRIENVSSDAFDDHSTASTLRTTLSYRTLPYRGLSLFAEAQNVSPLLNDDGYRNAGAGHLANDVTDRPVIADPAQTRMQQAYLRYSGFGSVADVGRRETAFGDHRFVGTVAWRQNHQTFDGIHLENRLLPKTRLSYAYVDKVIRVNGGEREMNSHLLNGLVAVDEDISLELFGYLLDYDEPALSALSSKTFGFRLSGSRALIGDWRNLFELEYAHQTDYGDNPSEFSAGYLELMAGIGLGERVHLKLGRERLGGGDAGALQTTLATGHKFNGWADLFLTTPPEGLVDWYLSANGRLGKASWIVVYHDFGADQGGSAFGTELDAQLTFPTAWSQVLGAKLARFRGEGPFPDTNKFWVWTSYSF